MSQIIAFSNKANKELDNLKELYLPCPRSSRRSVYFCNDKGNLYEIQKVTGPGRKSAWFINSFIYKDGATRFITPLDPLFMALPILHQAYLKDNKFKTVDDIFSRENVTLEIVAESDDEEVEAEEQAKPIDVHRLATIPAFTKQLAHLCDIKEIGSDLYVYKLNEEKALNWLAKKVERLISNSAFKETFETSEQDENTIKLEAAYTLANYLNMVWFKKLLNKLEVTEPKDEEELEDITNYATDYSPTAFFKRTHPDELSVDSPAKKSKPSVPRSLAKVNTRGMKPLTSFFQKK